MKKKKASTKKSNRKPALAGTVGSALSAYDRDVLRTAKENHIWLNAFACVRPTTELKLQIADWVLDKLNEESARIYDYQDSADANMRAIGKLTPEVILRVNKS